MPASVTHRFVRAGSTRAELVERLYCNIVPIVIMSLTFAGAGAMIVQMTPDGWLGVLFGLGLAAGAARVAVVFLFRWLRPDLTDPSRAELWDWLYATGSFTFASVTGSFLAQSVAQGEARTQMLVVLLLFGYGCGLVTRLSVRPWICIPSLALATVFPVAAFVRLGSPEHLAAAAVISVFSLGSIETVIWIYRSSLAEIRLRQELAGLARHDALTGLPNRLMFQERLASDLAALGRGPALLALHLVDLDRFKPVNDALGHPVGDALLKAVAGRLAGLIRPNELAARLGGDEFAIVQVGIGQAAEADLLARRIVRALQRPFAIGAHEIRIGASVGVALAPVDGTSSDQLLGQADAALYRTKSAGRNAFSRASTTALAS